MVLLTFVLAMLVMIDYHYRYKTETMLHFKNDHTLSIIYVVNHYNDHVQSAIDQMATMKHELIIVDVDGAFEGTLPDGVRHVSFESSPGTRTITRLFDAYRKGVNDATHPYLLFMDDTHMLTQLKTLNTLADNLSENQILTMKPSYPFREKHEGYAMFYDLFDDMQFTNEKINPHFFLMKEETVSFCELFESALNDLEALEYYAHMKNISIVHATNQRNLFKLDSGAGYKLKTRTMIDTISEAGRMFLFSRVILFMFVFHLFYIFAFWYWNMFSPFALIIVPITYYVAMYNFHRANPINYVLLPIYMLYFYGVLIVGVIRKIIKKIGSITPSAKQN